MGDIDSLFAGHFTNGGLVVDPVSSFTCLFSSTDMPIAPLWYDHYTGCLIKGMDFRLLVWVHLE